MSPRKVRRKYVRVLIVAGFALIPFLVLGFFWPVVWVAPVVILLFGASVFLLCFGIPCTVIATVVFIRTGYWTNPFRHGPWGDWKGEW